MIIWYNCKSESSKGSLNLNYPSCQLSTHIWECWLGWELSDWSLGGIRNANWQKTASTDSLISVSFSPAKLSNQNLFLRAVRIVETIQAGRLNVGKKDKLIICLCEPALHLLCPKCLQDKAHLADTIYFICSTVPCRCKQSASASSLSFDPSDQSCANILSHKPIIWTIWAFFLCLMYRARIALIYDTMLQLRTSLKIILSSNASYPLLHWWIGMRVSGYYFWTFSVYSCIRYRSIQSYPQPSFAKLHRTSYYFRCDKWPWIDR